MSRIGFGLLAALMLATTVADAQQPPAPNRLQIAEACGGDIDRLCPGVPPGQGRNQGLHEGARFAALGRMLRHADGGCGSEEGAVAAGLINATRVRLTDLHYGRNFVSLAWRRPKAWHHLLCK